MRIEVHVAPNAREPGVAKSDEGRYEVRVDERPDRGRANKRLVEILSDYFGVPKSRVVIVRGSKSRDKVVEILE